MLTLILDEARGQDGKLHLMVREGGCVALSRRPLMGYQYPLCWSLPRSNPRVLVPFCWSLDWGPTYNEEAITLAHRS